LATCGSSQSIIIERAETKSADTVCRTDVSIDSDGETARVGGNGNFEKVIELGAKASGGNFSRDKGVFDDGAGDVVAHGGLNSDPFGIVTAAVCGDEETIVLWDFVVTSAVGAAALGTVGGTQTV
jgi:hypothetical protein